MIKKIIGIALVLTIIFLLNNSVKQYPPMGKLLNPFSGYPALIKSDNLPQGIIIFPNISDTVNVKWDELRIPHIEAKNEHDLYFMQGYIMAFDRLWQMEFQTHSAAGRLSEILGDKMLNYDRLQRRKGMVYAAENTIGEIKKDSSLYSILKSFSDGINFYIDSIDKNKYPIEYKILNYEPEKWTTIKTSLLLKSMAWGLTNRTEDLEYTKILNDFGDRGEEVIEELFPIFSKKYLPIVDKDKLSLGFTPYKKEAPESIYKSKNYKIKTSQNKNSSIGSNNWVIGSKRTKNNNAILSNDPHLNLNLPSIWYLMHLKCPTINVMGVTIPGSPGIIIGFNDKIAWGVTNGYDDSMDWYDIQYESENRIKYKYGEYTPHIKQRIEEIKIKNNTTFYDTVLYTHHGPIVWDFKYYPKDSMIVHDNYGIALQWTAHDSTNELLSFYLLNKASNYEEFKTSLKNYDCPGQNFIYSDINDNIAILHSGKNPIKFNRQGMFISDGSDPYYDWDNQVSTPDYIPFEHKIFDKNPNPRWYLTSANQNPIHNNTDYYYLSEHFAPSYRATQIHKMINDKNTNMTIQDMINIQLDNTSLFAQATLPKLLLIIEEKYKAESKETKSISYEWIDILKKWDYQYTGTSIAPTFFEEWINDIEKNTWADDLGNIIWPEINKLEDLIINSPNSIWFDIKTTDKKETLIDICSISFKNIVQKLTNKSDIELEWKNYRGTDILHLAKISPFSSLDLKTSGSENIINATRKNEGPSWRYIIEMSQPYKIKGIYPGGQSGYPGSIHYNQFIEDWVNGNYYDLKFLDNNEFTGIELQCIPNH